MTSPILGQIYFPDSPGMLFRWLVVALTYILGLAIEVGIVSAICFLFTLPMRRKETARLFLDLLAGALARGQSVEEMIVSVARSQETIVGPRFHIVTAHLEAGLRFDEALDKEPRFLPPQIAAMLKAGIKLGDLKKVLPACRETLRDQPLAMRTAMNYLILSTCIMFPGLIGIFGLLTVFIVPKFKDLAAGMGVHLPWETLFVFEHTGWLVITQLFLFLILALIVILYLSGPQFLNRFRFQSIPLIDWITWRVPWKRKQLQRTFSAMLAVLLDGGVPEPEAVRLAGECTRNEICRRRAQKIIAALERGIPLDTAAREFDDTGEFQWRMANAAHSHGGFLPALKGWHEALDAKAFQQQETAAHLFTTSVVIINGVTVALVVTAMFGMLTLLLKQMVLSS